VKLRRLEINGFGKFNDFQLQLKDGLNVVYGYNESGKSTLAAFIRAIFFGFKKDHTRTRSYKPEYDRFIPWQAAEYSGAVEYELDGKAYRVERHFDKKNEEVRIFRLNPSQDITRNFSYNKYKREYVFGEEHLGLHEKVFSNSVFLEQGSFSVDSEEAAPFIKEKLVNLLMTGDEEISLKKAVQVLDRAAEDIGTPRAQKKPLGEASARLKRLERDLDEVKEHIKSLNEKEILLTEKRQQLAATRDEVELLQQGHRYMEAADHFKNYTRLGEKLELLQPEEVADKLREQRQAFEQCRLRTEQERKELGELEEQIRVDNPEFWMERIDTLNDTISNMVGESSDLDHSMGDSIEKARTRKKQARTFMGISLLVVLATLAGIYLQLAPVLQLVVPGILAVMVLGVVAYRNYQLAREIARSGHEVEVRRNMNRLLIMENQNLLNDIITQLGAQEVDEAQKVLQDAVLLRNRKQEYLKQIEKSQRDILSLEGKIQNLEERMIQVQEVIQERDKEIAILRSLGFKDVEESTRDFYEISEKIYQQVEQTGNDSLEHEITRLGQLYEQIILEIGKLEQQCEERPELLERYSDLQAEVLHWRARLDELNETLKVLSLARQGIMEAVEGYQDDYLQQLNQCAGEIVTGLFGGRYTTVQLTEDLRLMTVAPETRKLIEASDTSQGSLELFYLALRLALTELFSSGEQKLFLIMDEPFANLDSPRTLRFLEFLNGQAREKQVIVMTCREEVLNHLPTDTHIIDLQASCPA
jgi:uncharacterized protein YhaN